MKRVAFLVAVVGLSVFLTSCQKEPTTDEGSSSVTPATSTAEPAAGGGTTGAAPTSGAGKDGAPTASPTTKGEELQINPNAGNFQAGSKT